MEELSLDTIHQEGILIKEQALWHVKKLEAQVGTLFLTKKRIVFKKDVNPLTGAIIKLFSKKKFESFERDIPLDKIKDITNETLGMNRNMLVLSSTDNSKAKFLVRDFTQWQDNILELIVKNSSHVRNQY